MLTKEIVNIDDVFANTTTMNRAKQ